MLFWNMLKTLRLCSRIGVLASQKTTKIVKKREQNHFKISVCKNNASEDDFFTLKAFRGSSGRLWDDFEWIWGSPGGPKKGPKSKRPARDRAFLDLARTLCRPCADLVPTLLDLVGPCEVSGYDFEWILLLSAGLLRF